MIDRNVDLETIEGIQEPCKYCRLEKRKECGKFYLFNGPSSDDWQLVHSWKDNKGDLYLENTKAYHCFRCGRKLGGVKK